MVALQNLVADAEDFTSALEAPGGWSDTLDPVAAGFSSGADTTEPDWYTEWFGDGDTPYDPDANNLTCWFKFTVPPGEGRALFVSTEGSYYGVATSFDTTIFVFAAPVTPTTLFEDTFTRTVASGLGGAYEDDPDGWSEDPVSVDGSTAVAGGANYGVATVFNASVPHPTNFDLMFDISTASVGDTPGYLWITLGKMYFEVYPNTTTGDPITYTASGGRMVSQASNNQLWSHTDLALDADEVYRWRVRHQNGLCAVRYWKVGDAEPDTWYETWDATAGFDAAFWMDFESGSDGDVYTLDNLKVVSTDPVWFDWDSMPPYPGNGRCYAYSDDVAAWSSGPEPPKWNSRISPTTYESDGMDGLPFFSEGTYLVCIGSYMQGSSWSSGVGEYVIEAALTEWSPPAPAAIVLSNNWRDAVDMVPVLPPNPTINNGVQYTDEVSVSGFTTDPNDPDIELPVVTELHGTKGFRTGWVKAVLPNPGVLMLDTGGTTYKNALILYSYDEATDQLTQVDVAIPYAATIESENWLMPHVMNGDMIAGQNAMPTGIPGVPHSALSWRKYAIVEVDQPGPTLGWNWGGTWWESPPYPDTVHIDIDVYLSMWNVGYAKNCSVYVENWSYTGLYWTEVPGTRQASPALGDSRLGTSWRYTKTVAVTGLTIGTGKFRLVIEDTSWGSEIWTSIRKLGVRGYWHSKTLGGSLRLSPKFAKWLAAGTYLICLTQYEDDGTRTTAKLTASLTHPRR